jgi:adenylate kinase
MHKYIIMGPQGSGKGTQAKRLQADLDLVHISVGDIFRWNIKNHTKLGARVQRIVTAGGLVPDELVDEVVRQRLDAHDWNYGFILDGFPRSRPQAEFFLANYDCDAVILIDVPDEVVFQRAVSRRLCPKCGRDYNLISHRPALADTCDACRGPLTARADDTPEAVRARLRDYHAQTEPVLELFRQRGLVIVADGGQSPEEVYQDIRRQLGPPRRGGSPQQRPTPAPTAGCACDEAAYVA